MNFKNVLLVVLTFAIVLASGCGSQANCPVCGTTKNDGYALINVIPVPEHAINTIGGANSVAQAGNNASSCVPTIPPMLSAGTAPLTPLFTRFGCRTGFTTPPFSLPGGVGPNGLFGGFPGAQCCASRANGVNPLSAPDGEAITADGKTLFIGNGSSSVVVFDLTTNPATVIATIPTGSSPDFDGPAGVAPCIASASGRAFTDATCGDLRADEMSYDEKDKILLVTNGDPGFPFMTLIDMSAVVARTGPEHDEAAHHSHQRHRPRHGSHQALWSKSAEFPDVHSGADLLRFSLSVEQLGGGGYALRTVS